MQLQQHFSSSSPPVVVARRRSVRIAPLRGVSAAGWRTHGSSSAPPCQAPKHQQRPLARAAPALPQSSTSSSSSGSTSSGASSGSAGKKAAPLAPPYNVVITGSTKGIGRALAERFLQEGDTVLITSRARDRVDATVQELRKVYGEARVKGVPADVAQARDVKALADYAKRELGHVDIWINNAGTNGYQYTPLMESDDEQLAEIVGTNVLGVMLCCKEAIRVMRDQSSGHIFNMDGAGADGSPTPRFAAYGATKRSLQQLGASLGAELSQAGIKNVVVHNLSPGMVTTELLMAGANTPSAKFFINCLAEEPKDVAEFLVPRVRKVPQESVNPLTGSLKPVYIKFLTKGKAYSQIIQRLVTGSRKGRFVSE